MKNVRILGFLVLLIFAGCKKEPAPKPPVVEEKLEIRGADMSFLPEVRSSGIVFYNAQNQPQDMLRTLKNADANVIRLRLWKNPIEATSSLKTVKGLAAEAKNVGFKIMLTVHYSDTWADPAHQTKPQQWQSVNLDRLKDSVYAYTLKIMQDINPDYIQLGNEINDGFLWPQGSMAAVTQFKELLDTAAAAVRKVNPQTKIIIHFAGFADAQAFYTIIAGVDYDIIGLSYYPLWHGKNLDELQQALIAISSTQQKPIFIAETSYPFTFGWNDWTNNIIGADDQILPQFPATPAGQKDFLLALQKIVAAVPNGLGFCYWGGEWVSYQGSTATNGSSWENQAFYNFSNQALPVLEAF